MLAGVRPQARERDRAVIGQQDCPQCWGTGYERGIGKKCSYDLRDPRRDLPIEVRAQHEDLDHYCATAQDEQDIADVTEDLFFRRVTYEQWKSRFCEVVARACVHAAVAWALSPEGGSPDRRRR